VAFGKNRKIILFKKEPLWRFKNGLGIISSKSRMLIMAKAKSLTMRNKGFSLA
jgi:hypothetical protein